MEVIIGKSAEFIEKAQAIRYQVFTVEQNIPNELDFDGLDSIAEHALVTETNQSVATARLVINTDGSSVMARVAVLKAYRGRGIASIVVNKLIEHAKEQGISMIEIHAHSYLRSYYERLGFDFIQEVEIVGEHQLIEMHHQLVRT
ncbi:GNAT family N-acetyltransferase [Thaumasiovibrio sp. DFM-14]|uniref:GNAT family N-acetyltransferase n=1 Tax=Thaumasiovibrio sp. DFM-14 TaxID=3384792 RepID=UPI0039A062BD